MRTRAAWLCVVASITALCAGSRGVAGTHRTGFEAAGPGGFSRGGWDENVARRGKQKDGRFGLGLPGWTFTCRKGSVIVSRIGRGKGLGACDLGTGLGGPWPRPLVNGGVFVTDPQPGFGPYRLPLTFEATLTDIKGFLDAGTPTGGRPKFLGIVAEIETEGKTRLLAAGLRGVGALKLGIYELPRGTLLVEGPKLVAPKMPLVVRATCDARHFVLSFGASELRVPVPKAKAVRAIALRVSGVVAKSGAGAVDRAIVVQRMAITSPNVPDFPPAAQARPREGGPFLRRRGTRLLLDGRPFRAVGMNHINLLYHFAGLDTNAAFGEFVLRRLAAEGFTVLRVSCADHVPHFNKRDKVYALYRLFERDPDAYFRAFDRMVAAAQRAGVRLVPVLVWNSSNVAEHLGTSRWGEPNFAAIRRTYFDRRSREYAFLARYLTALARRYRNCGTILCWELGNEWQNTVPKTAAYYRYNPQNETPNPYIPKWKPRWEDIGGRDAWEQLRRAQAVCARLVKAADPNHLVLSAVESVSVHFAPDNRTYRAVMQRMIPSEVDLVGYHQYANSHGRRPMRPWGYSPFLTLPGQAPWTAHVEVIRATAAAMHGGRPVIIGETNVHHDPRPEMRAVRLANLENLLAAAANVSGEPRSAVVLGWDWIPLPDRVSGYTLYPASCRRFYDRPEFTPFVDKRLEVFHKLRAWYGLQGAK